MFFKSCTLAFKDYAHEKLLSACAILSLAAVLAPLLVLYGVKFGVITTMTDRLRNNPHNLEIIPVASGRYDKALLQELAQRPDVAFVLPKTRSIAATMSLSKTPEHSMLGRITVSLEPTGPGDVLFERFVQEPSSESSATATLHQVPENAFAVGLSSEAARKLKVAVGDMIFGRVERAFQGKIERADVSLWVEAILPLEAQQKDVAFVPLSLLEATEDFRDGRAPHEDARLLQEQGWTGEPLPQEERIYPAFRLYARSLDDVAVLHQYFHEKNIEVYTQAEQIATVNSLNDSLTLIFGLIGSAAALGFFASTGSNALAAVRRKERHLGILRLLGYASWDMMAFPLFQSMLTALLGTGFAAALYYVTAVLIDKLFATNLQGVESICSLTPIHFAASLVIVVGLSFVATLVPAARAANIEPSEVIRDI